MTAHPRSDRVEDCSGSYFASGALCLGPVTEQKIEDRAAYCWLRLTVRDGNLLRFPLAHMGLQRGEGGLKHTTDSA